MNFAIYTIFPFPEGKKIFTEEAQLNDYLKYLFSIIPEVTKDDGIPVMPYSYMQFLENHIQILKIDLDLCKMYRKIFQSKPRVKKDVL